MAEVDVRLLDGIDECIDAAALFAQVWGEPPVTPVMLLALAHAGNHVAGAYAGAALVGAVAGFLGDGTGLGVHLHSHVAAVLPSHRGRRVGAALKWHQRDWALAHGIECVTWTFDPLIRRNGAFNLRLLGAVVHRYQPELYGTMDDAINRGDPSDRFLARWDLCHPRVVGAATGGPVIEPCVGARASAEPALVVTGGRPQAVATAAPARLVPTPDDIEGLRHSDPALAATWRSESRAALADAQGAGLVATGMTPAGEYVLTAPGEAPA